MSKVSQDPAKRILQERCEELEHENKMLTMKLKSEYGFCTEHPTNPEWRYCPICGRLTVEEDKR